MANLFCIKDRVVIITGGAGILGCHDGRSYRLVDSW